MRLKSGNLPVLSYIAHGVFKKS